MSHMPNSAPKCPLRNNFLIIPGPFANLENARTIRNSLKIGPVLR